MKERVYHNIVEGYGAFSIYAALSCPIRKPIPTNTCFCTEPEDFYPKKNGFTPKCIETGYCKYCDINKQDKCRI
jgi:hypothetical protein